MCPISDWCGLLLEITDLQSATLSVCFLLAHSLTLLSLSIISSDSYHCESFPFLPYHHRTGMHTDEPIRLLAPDCCCLFVPLSLFLFLNPLSCALSAITTTGITIKNIDFIPRQPFIAHNLVAIESLGTRYRRCSEQLAAAK